MNSYKLNTTLIVIFYLITFILTANFIPRQQLQQALDQGQAEEAMQFLCSFSKETAGIADSGKGFCFKPIVSQPLPYNDGRNKITKINNSQFGDVYEVEDTVTGQGAILKNSVVPALDEYMIKKAIEDVNLGRKSLHFKEAGHHFNLMTYTGCCIEMYDTLHGKEYSFYIEMERSKYGSLRNFMTKDEYYPYRTNINWKINVVLGILDGMNTLHEANYVHRDLKPENIIMQEIDIPLLSDFGFISNVPSTATDVGTPIYVAPEVKNGTNYDNKVDIYSMGMIMFEIFNSGFVLTKDYKKDILSWCNYQQEGNVRTMFNFPDFSIEYQERAMYCKYINAVVVQMLDDNPANRPTARTVFDFFMAAKENTMNYYEQLNNLYSTQGNSLKLNYRAGNAVIDGCKNRVVNYINNNIVEPVYTNAPNAAFDNGPTQNTFVSQFQVI